MHFCPVVIVRDGHRCHCYECLRLTRQSCQCGIIYISNHCEIVCDHIDVEEVRLTSITSKYFGEAVAGSRSREFRHSKKGSKDYGYYIKFADSMRQVLQPQNRLLIVNFSDRKKSHCNHYHRNQQYFWTVRRFR